MHKIPVFGIAMAIVILAVCIGTVTAYTNYETVWTSSGNQIVNEGDTGLVAGSIPTYTGGTYYFTIDNLKEVYLITPFVNTITLTGTHPRVRWLYFQLQMPTGARVRHVYVYSGSNLVYSVDVDWQGDGTIKDYTLDMKSYKDMVRGIQTAIVITNTLDSPKTVDSYGAGARWDW